VKAWIIAVGSEMLTPFRVDTNSLAITERLNAIGCDVRLKAVVGDDVGDLVMLLERAIGTVDIVVVTGGLGPTEDDITRDALARALKVPMDLDEGTAERIRQRFARRGLEMAEINRRQAMVPRGAVMLENPRGTAPGLWVERENTAIVLLPGPPREMRPMFEEVVATRLGPRAGGAAMYRRVLKIAGRTESDVDARAQPVYSRWTEGASPIGTTILAVMGQIELHLSTVAADRLEGEGALDRAVAQLQEALGPSVYSSDGRGLERVLGDLIQEEGWRVGTAESCTGGLLASRLTDVPGSSDYFESGFVCYSNRAKIEWLGVPRELIEAHGAVSEPVAGAMADGVRARAGVEVGIGITGIAGPGGGTADKPVGTVAIAVVCPKGIQVRTFQFVGDREQVKFQSTQAAMNMLRLMLIAGRPR
jgi:nicotinamide-nucleotide amidase